MIDRAVCAVVHGIDRDTVVHQVVFKLMTREETRASSSGYNLIAGVRALARNHGIDFARREKREIPTAVVGDQRFKCSDPEEEASSHQLLARFRARLPKSLVQVFELRFVQQRSQRNAAKLLGMPPTTLAYHEDRIRALMDRFSTQVEV